MNTFTPGQSLTWTIAPACGCANPHGGQVSFRRYLDATREVAEVFTCRGSVNVAVAELVPA